MPRRFRATRILFPTVLAVLLLLLPSAAMAAALSGRVLDPSGQPVDGASVIVDGPVGVRTATTGTDGRFEIPALPPAAYRVLVEAPGFASQPQIVRVDEVTPARVEIALAVAPVTEAVIVSASPVPMSLSEAPASASVVTRGEIERRQLESVADILRTTPGFAVGRNGGRGALTSVFPRGGDSDYTLVFVDGMRVNTFGGGFDFSLLPFGDVAQVEVVRGPQSAVFGSDAIGGIVQLRTLHGGEPSASAQLEGGGEGTMRAVGGGRGTWRDWSLGVGGEHNRSDGFKGIAPATGEIVSNDDWRSSSLTANAGWSRAAAGVRVDARWLDSERGNPGPFGSNPIGVFTAVDRIARGSDAVRQFGATGHAPWGTRLASRVQQRFRISTASLGNRFHASFGDSFFDTRRVTAGTQTDVIVTPTTGLTAGVELLSERARGTYLTGAQFQQVPIERRTFGTFVEVRQDLGARASITAGLRVDAIRRDALEANPDPFGPRPAFGVDTVTTANPRIAARYVAWQDARGMARTTVRASAGTGIRPPDAFEIAFTDNPALKPERSRSLDVGVSHVVAPALTVDATLFVNRYDDLIVAVGKSLQNASRYRTDNISNARARGLEVGGDWRRGDLTARLAYTFLSTDILAVDAADAAPQPFSIGDPLVRRPRHQATIDVGWTAGRLSSFGELRVRSSVLDIEPSFGAFGGLFTAAGFAVLDAGATWRVTRHVDVFARGLNLLGRDYEEAFGYPAPGRLGMAGVRIAVRP